MNLKVEIRRNADGVVATDIWVMEGTYWWEEGNASCDWPGTVFYAHAR